MTPNFALTILAASVDFGSLITSLLVALAAVIVGTRSRLDWPQNKRFALKLVSVYLLLLLFVDSVAGNLAVVWLLVNQPQGDFGIIAQLLMFSIVLVLVAMPVLGCITFLVARG